MRSSAILFTSLVMAGAPLGTSSAKAGAVKVGDRAEKSSAAAFLLQPSVIVAGSYVTPDGTIKPDVALFLSDGKIERVAAPTDVVNGDGVVRHPSAVISPGLIDVRSSMGAYGNTVESAYSVDPGASAIDAFDPNHRDFRRAVESGITTAVIVPAPANLIAGACAVVKTSGGANARAGRVLRDDGPLVLGFGSMVWKYDREPTSRIGSMAMLRDVLREARAGRGHGRLRAFVSGKLDGMMFCKEPMDVSAALRTLRDLPARFSVVHTSEVHDLGEELSALGAIAIVGPYSFSTEPRTLAAAGALSDAGVAVAFAGRMPVEGGHALRTTAALAVRYGMGAPRARQAMTVSAAKACGVAERVGAIRPGFDADLVIFSDDPLRLDAQVLAVYVDGVRVFSSDQHVTMSKGGER